MPTKHRSPFVAISRGILIAGGFVFFYIGAFIFSWLGRPLLWLFVRTPAARVRVCQLVVHRWTRGLHHYLSACRLIQLDLDAHPGELPAGPCVMIANHQTLVDITALLSLYPEIYCVGKKRLFRDPFMGGVFRGCDFIPGGGDGPFDGSAVVLAGLDRLRRGRPVMVFPEGTRSPLGGLRPFQRGAFEIACRGCVPVVPFLIRCQPVILNRAVPLRQAFSTTSIYTVERLPELHPADWQGDAGRMAEEARARFLKLLAP